MLTENEFLKINLDRQGEITLSIVDIKSTANARPIAIVGWISLSFLDNQSQKQKIKKFADLISELQSHKEWIDKSYKLYDFH